MYTKLRGFCLGVMTVWMMSLAVVSYADDTEIYFARADVDNEENKPRANVMIMLDTSGSMRLCDKGSGQNWCPTVNKRRINLLHDALEGILNNTPESVNIGLGRFDAGTMNPDGGNILVPVVPVNEKTKPYFAAAINNINPQGKNKSPGSGSSVSPYGYTPTARAYAEMARYMLGLQADHAYGNNPPTVTVCDTTGDPECEGFPKVVGTVKSCTGKDCKGVYISPINTANQCESNHIILFTDGEPTEPESVSLDGGVTCTSGRSGTNNYTCQTRIAKHLNSESNSLGVPVFTHNIGLYMGGNESKMRSVSDAGGGATHDSDSAESLLSAFLSTIDLIDAQSRSISAPGVAVNTMNRFQHLDELYYAVFQPAESSFWEGNLKRYQLVGDEIHGAGGNAIDASTGYFSPTAQGIWGDVVDGADATKGGARSQLSERNLFYSGPAGVSGVGVTSPMVWANASNANLAPRTDFFDWPAGVSITRANMFHGLKTMWADPMHSVPLMVNYGEDQNYVFVSTNGGMLHIIDTSDGSEVSAFMPYEMMRRAPEITSKPGLDENNIREIYGLDASWIAWRKPGEEVTDGPEAVYIYGGMRRGGRHFYALDVTTPASPSLKWQINAGDVGFERLGQTWSTPTLIKVPTSDGAVPALIFGGGYSPVDHDGPTHTLSAGDEEGNAIYIVNAENGDLLWSATHETHAEMKWAIPGGVSVVDINFDGVADHLYFGDLGGQIFRVDMEAGGDHSVHRIANLGRNTAGSSENGDQRRFYEAPAVAYVKSGAENHLYIVAASGYRAHPLDEVTNEGMFVIFDEDALYGTTSATVTLSDMANVSGVSPAEVASDDKGWYYLFKDDADRSGEKALSSPVVFDNKILLSTYAPVESEVADNPCAVRYGAAFLHTVELRTGKAASILKDAPDDPNRKRSQGLSQSTPPPTPTLLVDEDGNLIVVVGTEVIGEGDLGDPKLRKRRWMQLPKDEAGEIRMRGADGGDDETDGDGDGEGG